MYFVIKSFINNKVSNYNFFNFTFTKKLTLFLNILFLKLLY